MSVWLPAASIPHILDASLVPTERREDVDKVDGICGTENPKARGQSVLQKIDDWRKCIFHL